MTLAEPLQNFICFLLLTRVLGRCCAENVHWCPRLFFSAECLKLLLRILMYCSFFTVPFTAIRFPGLLARKHHQSIRLFDSGDGVLRFETSLFYIK